MFKLLASTAVAIVLTACSNIDVEPGSGPLTLSYTVERGFEEYLKRETPRVFVVSEDGNYYHYYYCAGDACRQSNYTHDTIERCEKGSNLECKIYAFGRDIVWKF